MFLTKTFVIQDCPYYNDGTKTTGLIIDSGCSCTVEDGALKITTSTSGEKKVTLPVELSSSDNWLFEVELAKIGVEQYIAMRLFDYNTWYAMNHDGLLVSNLNGYSTKSVTISVGDKLQCEYNNGTLTLKHNDVTFKSGSVSSNPVKFYCYTNRDGSTSRIQYIKNIKIKPL